MRPERMHGGLLLVLLGVLAMCAGCSGPTGTAVPERPTDSGARMLEVGQRFERLGRAGIARRWDLAAYEVEEIEELFEELPRAKPPGETSEEALRQLERGFLSVGPEALEKALASRDPTEFASAFAKVSATCNGCHQATGHPFIEISAEPGAGVPKLSPVP